jgi:hypothetical protein
MMRGLNERVAVLNADLAGLPLETTGSPRTDSLGVSSTSWLQGGERIRIETPPTIIESVSTLISNGKAEVINGNE